MVTISGLRAKVVHLLSIVLCNTRKPAANGTVVRRDLLNAVGTLLLDQLDGLDDCTPANLDTRLDMLKASVNLILVIMLCNKFGAGDDDTRVQSDDPLAAVLLRMEDFLDSGAIPAAKDKFEDEKIEIVSLLNGFFGERTHGKKVDSIDLSER